MHLVQFTLHVGILNEEKVIPKNLYQSGQHENCVNVEDDDDDDDDDDEENGGRKLQR